ncbi:MAG: hypothetical protein COZ12_00805 [Deltaproteobacteria bacterium CG_4_10_14_3_um_filter_60_8]|nr:MAG: hypothetical protein AUK28_00970 [Desulfobacterales bacterium CG2_30_60_27]PIP42887.1 MAG: hypothetical protein COX17_10050 [Deltaproteobacteria bacterium CG23_combo_of_CG06-09_8_20_14_all_60_8]PIY24721.1 MAG: hypothetical protein COZ12_00805 [Deltaproteobacteria bacterium CG_4_10_14_3_um_filter_60_8]
MIAQNLPQVCHLPDGGQPGPPFQIITPPTAARAPRPWRLNLQVLLAVVVLLCLVAAGCAPTPAKPLPVLRIGHAPHDHHAPLYIAALNPEYFKEHGGIYLAEVQARKEYRLMQGDRPLARVLIEASTGGEELIRKLAEGQFDLALGGFPAMLNFIDQGRPLRVLAPVMSEGAGLVVRKGLPIADWADFAGYVQQKNQPPLRIGYPIAVSVQGLIFAKALTEAGIIFSEKLDDARARVVLVNLFGTKNLLPALESGLIDGFVAMQPFLAMAEAKGAGQVVASLADLPPKGRWQGYPCCALAGNNAYVHAQLEVATAMVSLLSRASRFLATQPEKSAEQVGQWLGVPAAVEARSLPTIHFLDQFDASWKRGAEFWVASLVADGTLHGRVKEAYLAGKLPGTVYDLEILERARRNQ